MVLVNREHELCELVLYYKLIRKVLNCVLLFLCTVVTMSILCENFIISWITGFTAILHYRSQHIT